MVLRLNEMIKAIGKLFALAFGNPTGDGKTFHPSQTCPECGSKLMRAAGRDELHESQIESQTSVKDRGSCNSPLRDANANWLCPNPDCPAQIRAQVVLWCSPGAMDIPGGDVALAAVLVNKGLVRDVAELYRLKAREIAALPGMDRDSAQKFFDAITASRKREAWRALFGLGIPQVRAEEAKSLCRHFASVDNVFAAGAERLMEADGISEVIARSIMRWHGDPVNRKLAARLYKAGVNFKSGLSQPR
jgi:DNA ligase (NAD+)